MREITYAQAINEGLWQAMELSKDVIIMGQLVDYKPGIFGTTKGLADRFGTERVRDFPNAEALMNATGIGAALTGMRPVIVHPRIDFMMYGIDAIVNWLSLWRFKSNKKSNLPVTIRAIVGKGWGQGPQHSKSLHAWFAHLPGLRVAMPATAYDAKGLLLESIFGESPTLIIENRSLYSMIEDVPKEPYRVKFGQACVRRKGKDVTFVAVGLAVPLALRSAEILKSESIDVEVIDLRTISPIDRDTILESVAKTKILVVADSGWPCAGIAGEIIAQVTETQAQLLKANPLRITLPDSHTPMSSVLEEKYYLNEEKITQKIRTLLITARC